MGKKKKELDVDFIGGQTSITKVQEQILSEHFRKIRKSRVARSKVKSAKLPV